MLYAMDDDRALALLGLLVDYDEGDQYNQAHYARLISALHVAWPHLVNRLNFSALQPHRKHVAENDCQSKNRAAVGEFFEAWGRAIRRTANVDLTNEIDELRQQRDELANEAAMFERHCDQALEVIPQEFRRSSDGQIGPLVKSVQAMVERMRSLQQIEARCEAEEDAREELFAAATRDEQAATELEAKHQSRGVGLLQIAAALIRRLIDANAAHVEKLDAAERALPLEHQKWGTLAQCIAKLAEAHDRKGEEAERLQTWFYKQAPWHPVPGDELPPLNTEVLVAVDWSGMGQVRRDVATWDGQHWMIDGSPTDIAQAQRWPVAGVFAWRPLPTAPRLPASDKPRPAAAESL